MGVKSFGVRAARGSFAGCFSAETTVLMFAIDSRFISSRSSAYRGATAPHLYY